MAQELGFDPELPELGRLFDLAAVGRLFEDGVLSKERPARVRSCKLQDTKYQPGRCCVTTYVLQTEGEGGAGQTIGVAELGPAGLALRLYDEDPRLPALAEAADVARMATRFAALLGSVVISCAVVPVRYRPGARCVFRYEVQTHRGGRVVFGKLMGDGGAELAATVGALHRASQERPGMPRVLPVLAYWPELGMLAQDEVSGRAELNDLAFSPEVPAETRERWLRDAGARLAALHALTGIDAPARTAADDMDELREYVAPMRAADPALAARYEGAVGRLAELAGQRDEPPAVASHGAFRTDQFMIAGDELVMIDLDGFCWANPARDLGNFLAYLDWKAIRQPQRAELIRQAAGLLLEGYRGAGGTVDEGWLELYRADSLLKIAGRRYRSLTVKEWGLVPQLLDAAERR
ncbi:MAG: hypothetical protein RLZZ387_1337 [Chloroflexota bacterium]|jgi:hypothetical protein